MIWHDMKRYMVRYEIRYGMASYGALWYRLANYGMQRYMVGYEIRYDMVSYGIVCQTMVCKNNDILRSMIWYDLKRYDMVRYR